MIGLTYHSAPLPEKKALLLQVLHCTPRIKDQGLEKAEGRRQEEEDDPRRLNLAWDLDHIGKVGTYRTTIRVAVLSM